MGRPKATFEKMQREKASSEEGQVNIEELTLEEFIRMHQEQEGL